MKKFIKILFIAFSLFIFWIIYLANSNSESIFFSFIASIPLGDKIGHFFLFGFLTYLGNIALNFRTIKTIGLTIYLGTVLVLAFIVLEEYSQIYIASRTFDFKDLLADFVGISMGTIATYYSKPFFSKPKL